MALDPIITYNAQLLQPGVDLTVSGIGTPNISASYGDYGTGSPRTLKASCSLSISYSDVTWTINNDNSVTVQGNITGGVLTRSATGRPSTNTQLIQAWFNNKLVFSQIVNTASSGTYDLNIPSSFSVTIPPSTDPQPQYPAAIHFLNDNQQITSSPPDEFALGILITNPNPPDYRPGAIYADGEWKSHNRSGGAANILGSNGQWIEMRTISGGTGTGNPPEIWHSSSNKYNMRKVGAS